MSFLTLVALGIAVLVAAPYLAHRLRRRRADEVPFAPARLVPPSPPKARRRSRLEDRSLFAIRAVSIVALALLGASPLVRCSRLALSRGGASVAVAIVLDDSMSMRAKDGTVARTRFERAKEGAQEILAALREGDAAAIVLAGAPSRVGLAATTDIAAAKAALEGVTASDRATDLDGALTIAQTLVGELPRSIAASSSSRTSRTGGPTPPRSARARRAASPCGSRCRTSGSPRPGPRTSTAGSSPPIGRAPARVSGSRAAPRPPRRAGASGS